MDLLDLDMGGETQTASVPEAQDLVVGDKLSGFEAPPITLHDKKMIWTRAPAVGLALTHDRICLVPWSFRFITWLHPKVRQRSREAVVFLVLSASGS